MYEHSGCSSSYGSDSGRISGGEGSTRTGGENENVNVARGEVGSSCDTIVWVHRASLFRVIFSSCYMLELPNTTAALSMVYLHKYLDFINPERYREETYKYIVLVAAIFLACKESETLKTVRNVFYVTLKLMNSDLTEADLNEVSPPVTIVTLQLKPDTWYFTGVLL